MRIADWNYCRCELLFGISVDANCYSELLNRQMLLGVSVDANFYPEFLYCRCIMHIDAQNYYRYERLLGITVEANISLE